MQAERDEGIKALASSMRDMLASLSEVNDLAKIELLRSVVALAMTRVNECANFINAYARHGFWGHSIYLVHLSAHLIPVISRPPRSSVAVESYGRHDRAISARFRRVEGKVQYRRFYSNSQGRR